RTPAAAGYRWMRRGRSATSPVTTPRRTPPRSSPAAAPRTPPTRCSPTSAASSPSELVSRGAVHVVRDLPLVAVTGGRRPRRLDHQDRPAGRRRLVLGAPGHDEYVALVEHDGGLAAVGAAQRDVEPAVEDEEELVGLVVDVPDVLAPGVGDPDVVVVHAGHDPRAVDVVERRQGPGQVHGLRLHAPIVRESARPSPAPPGPGPPRAARCGPRRSRGCRRAPARCAAAARRGTAGPGGPAGPPPPCSRRPPGTR